MTWEGTRHARCNSTIRWEASVWVCWWYVASRVCRSKHHRRPWQHGMSPWHEGRSVETWTQKMHWAFVPNVSVVPIVTMGHFSHANLGWKCHEFERFVLTEAAHHVRERRKADQVERSVERRLGTQTYIQTMGMFCVFKTDLWKHKYVHSRAHTLSSSHESLLSRKLILWATCWNRTQTNRLVIMACGRTCLMNWITKRATINAQIRFPNTKNCELWKRSPI